MPRQNTSFLAFNRGRVSRLGLARTDLKRLAMSAEIQTNYVSRVLGSTMLRPGLGYLGSSRSNLTAKYIPFFFAVDDTALLEITADNMRVWIDDAVLTRPSVSSAVANGNFTTNLTSWTDADESGATSDWVTGGYMGLTGNGTAAAIRRQQVTVGVSDQNVEHALRIVIQRGPVVLRVGSTSGGDEYITETTLGTGTHSLAFTPTGSSFWIQFQSTLLRITLVDSCNVEAAGAVAITAPWAAADLDDLRWDQSADVVFVACDGYQQRQIERRAERSWSVVLYQSNDGPFRTANLGPITMTPSVLTGNGTLTASAAFFKTTHVGALFAVTSTGQRVEVDITAQNTFSNPITVTGVGADRIFTIVLAGTWSATVVLQRSLDSDAGPWADVATKSWTANTTETFNDALDNQIAYYRIGVKTGGFTSGTVEASLAINTGTARGIGRVTAFTSATVVSIEVVDAFGQTTASDDWEEGEWSDRRGWPTCVGIYEGRLNWAGKDRLWASASDGFYEFDGEVEGDSAFFSRTIGSGPVDKVNWLMPLLRLMLGGQGAEFACRSTSFDEPLTPTNANIKRVSTQGSAPVPAVAIDSKGIFVQRGGTRVYELTMDEATIDYASKHISALIPGIGKPGIVRIAAQRQPDTRVHFVRSNGTVAMLVYDSIEQVLCWLDIETDGDIEDVVVLPGEAGEEEDFVYYLVKRTVNGATVRYLEKWAFERECLGDEDLCKLADSFVVFTNSPASATVTGLGHLEGEEVVVWADGACMDTADHEVATFTVTGGAITLTNHGEPYLATTGVVGLAYQARFKSAKLSQVASGLGDPMNAHKQIKSIGLCLADVHAQGLEYGQSFDLMDPMPVIENGAPVDPESVRADYNAEPIAFPGEWDTDARLCLRSNAPRPCTILSAVMEVEVHA